MRDLEIVNLGTFRARKWAEDEAKKLAFILCELSARLPKGVYVSVIWAIKKCQWWLKCFNLMHRIGLLTCSSFFFNFYFHFILLYNTVLILPYIDMNQPWVYMSSYSSYFSEILL